MAVRLRGADGQLQTTNSIGNSAGLNLDPDQTPALGTGLSSTRGESTATAPSAGLRAASDSAAAPTPGPTLYNETARVHAEYERTHEYPVALQLAQHVLVLAALCACGAVVGALRYAYQPRVPLRTGRRREPALASRESAEPDLGPVPAIVMGPAGGAVGASTTFE